MLLYLHLHNRANLKHVTNMIARCGDNLNIHPVLEKAESIFFQLAEVVSRTQIGDEATWSVKRKSMLVVHLCLNAVSTLVLLLHAVTIVLISRY